MIKILRNIIKPKSRKILLAVFLVLIFIYWLILPSNLFKQPVCTVITDENGALLGAHIASDGQYRFPPVKIVPEKFKQAILTFEDKRFYYHWGFDFIAFSRAIKQNLSNGEIVSGGSTITMQVIRLSRNKPRTVYEKIIEIILATRLEFSYSKDEILSMYASNAPFGGNVVGLDAAAWRYFATTTNKLTWAEATMLAVLPNSPALIHPGKNRKLLLKKRNRLLKKLFQNKTIDKETYDLSIDEPIPEKPNEFPNLAPHLLAKINLTNKNKSIIKTTLNADIQDKTNKIVKRHNKKLSANNINNIAAIIIDVETGDIKAYIGNIDNFKDKTNGNQVDIITSVRSTGSVLKPFLYASMLTEGEILPEALVYDIPTRMGGFSPKNYNRSYDGAVKARKALARSLNIPAARMLRSYGLHKFYEKLKKIGLKSLDKPASHYGLSLVLGGCEGSLWDITGMYASMARTLNHYEKYSNKYYSSDYHQPNYILRKKEIKKDKQPWKKLENNSFLSASAIWLTFKAMLDVERPDDENQWRMFESSERIAWKTGTSFGFRDAWAVGVTPRYAVGVWVGNADGEGRPGLVGVQAAAPVLFDIFDILPDASAWFPTPFNDMVEVETCENSGFIAGVNCDKTRKIWVPVNGRRFRTCPYHILIHTDMSGKFRVNSDCELIENMITKKWFVLPPAVENYYKSKNSSYKYLPPFRDDCRGENQDNNMDLIYPFKNLKIYVPVEIDGKLGKTIFEATHRQPNMTIFWYIDEKQVAQTNHIHQVELSPTKGKHTLTIVDENGEKITRKFEIVNE